MRRNLRPRIWMRSPPGSLRSCTRNGAGRRLSPNRTMPSPISLTKPSSSTAPGDPDRLIARSEAVAHHGALPLREFEEVHLVPYITSAERFMREEAHAQGFAEGRIEGMILAIVTALRPLWGRRRCPPSR